MTRRHLHADEEATLYVVVGIVLAVIVGLWIYWAGQRYQRHTALIEDNHCEIVADRLYHPPRQKNYQPSSYWQDRYLCDDRGETVAFWRRRYWE